MEGLVDVRQSILDAAERRIRASGYHGFSFREIAADVGVKSASVHYYFPVKADLARETAKRYRERFFEALGPAEDARAPAVKLARMIELFRGALHSDGRMCLCDVLGIEVSSLPGDVAAEAAEFFRQTLAWLEAAMQNFANPVEVLSLLEGALVVARSLNDTRAFDEAVANLERATVRPN